MKLALWDHPAARFLLSGLTEGDVKLPLEVTWTAPREAEQLLRAGEVHAALVPTVRVLTEHEDFDVIPAVALSAWRWPFAQLLLKAGLAELPAKVAFDPRHAQEALLTRILLQEHYDAKPSFTPYENPSVEDLAKSAEDAALLVGQELPGRPEPEAPAWRLDLGREWFELTNYPLVHGLFVMIRGEGDPIVVQALRRVVAASEEHRAAWSQRHPELASFFAEEVRLRLDDLATASLTEAKRLLYFYGAIDEVADFQFVDVPDEDPEEERELLL